MSAPGAKSDDLRWGSFHASLKGDPRLETASRRGTDVLHKEQLDFWALSRFEDLERAHRDANG